MNSENNSDIEREISTNEEEKSTMETKINNEEEELPAVKDENEAAVEQPIASNEEKQTDMEKSDTEKQEDLPKSENEMDAQPLFEQPVILEGKRSRKPTLRLEISEVTPSKKELSVPQGHGKPLGEIEYINYQITHASTDSLSRMRQICFGRRGNKATIRKNLREFKGFEFERLSDDYQKYLSNLTKLKKDQLRSISNILGLPSTGRNTEHAERILNFLIEPVDEGKRLPRKKSTKRAAKKRSTNSKESIDTDQETKKRKIETNHDEHGTKYVYKPGKTSSKKHSSTSDTEQEKGSSTEDEEVVKTNESDNTDSKSTEKTDQNEVIMNNAV